MSAKRGMILIEKDSNSTDLCRDIGVIEKECFSVPWTSRSIESQVLTEGSVCALIRDKTDNRPIGYICGQSVSDECELYRIAVLPGYRKQGAADRLMNYFLNKCRENGIKNVFLEVRCHNEPAKHLYEKHGFVKVGRRKNYYTEPVCDALIYKAEL
ncbi:MAG: ribosomal protein S18-alanine N-acetyltransferase [Ruminiclostridium sp.]|nr:ribosomal protein S18-alanine N-acetyltransferase [Ruminiclostridium sp.]